MSKSRQLQKLGRWVVFQCEGGMVQTMEGAVPRQGHTDWGDTRVSKHMNAAKVESYVGKLVAARIKDGWVETAVGWADAPPPSLPLSTAAARDKVAGPVGKLVAPRKAPALTAITKTRLQLVTAARARATKAGLAAWPQIEPLIRGSINLELSALKGMSPLGGSRIGGAPDLPPATPWPKRGRSLELVAQLRLEELASFDSDGLLPRAGLLSFFADLSPGSDEYLSEGVILYSEKLALVRHAPPTDTTLLSESAVAFTAAISLPPASGAFITKARLRNADEETYNDRVLVPLASTPCHRVLGYPSLTEVEDARSDEHCVLQISSDKKRKLGFGDAQTLRFYVRAAALGNRDFRRVRVSAEEQ